MTTAWLPTGSFLSGGGDKRIIAWDLDGNQIQILDDTIRVRQLEVSRDGSTLAVLIASRPEIRTYSTASCTLLETITAADKITTMAISNNGREILANSSFTEPKLYHWKNGGFTKSYVGHKQERYTIQCCFGGKNEEYVC